MTQSLELFSFAYFGKRRYFAFMNAFMKSADNKDKDKKERLAKALRENLLRRKAWQRAQQEKDKKREETKASPLGKSTASD